MYIGYKSKRLRRICEDLTEATKRIGSNNALKLFQRVSEIAAAESLFDLSLLPAPRLHPLKGKRAGQYSVDLVHPFRLIIKPEKDIKEYIENNEVNLKLIKSIIIWEIVNYHDKS